MAKGEWAACEPVKDGRKTVFVVRKRGYRSRIEPYVDRRLGWRMVLTDEPVGSVVKGMLEMPISVLTWLK